MEPGLRLERGRLISGQDTSWDRRVASAFLRPGTSAAEPLTMIRRRGGFCSPARRLLDSFLHRFGSALNHHVHLHACVTDGVFVPAAAEAGSDAPPVFLTARPITQADLAALTERVRRRAIRWFRRSRLLDAAAAADMLAWENSGFSVDASVRITLIDRDVPSYFQSLEHLLRYCARPPFALERLSVIRGEPVGGSKRATSGPGGAPKPATPASDPARKIGALAGFEIGSRLRRRCRETVSRWIPRRLAISRQDSPADRSE